MSFFREENTEHSKFCEQLMTRTLKNGPRKQPPAHMELQVRHPERADYKRALTIHTKYRWRCLAEGFNVFINFSNVLPNTRYSNNSLVNKDHLPIILLTTRQRGGVLYERIVNDTKPSRLFARRQRGWVV